MGGLDYRVQPNVLVGLAVPHSQGRRRHHADKCVAVCAQEPTTGVGGCSAQAC